jgi:hypothetical protein
MYFITFKKNYRHTHILTLQILQIQLYNNDQRTSQTVQD